jgi:hypothetical protein
LEKARRLQRVNLVALARGTSAHEVRDRPAIMLDVELGAETVERLLYALVARVRELEDGIQGWRRRCDEHPPVTQDEAVCDRPGAVPAARRDIRRECRQLRGVPDLAAQLVEQLERR